MLLTTLTRTKKKSQQLLILIGFLLGMSPVMALEIITIEKTENHHMLKTRAENIQFPLNREDKDLIEAMKKKLYALGGVGLAAPQVNSAKQIIAVYIPEEAQLLRDNAKIFPMHILINPSYKPLPHTRIISDFEGCYSVSSKAGKVPRYDEIRLKYYDEEGNAHQQIENGFYARVLQHEIDHLNGVLITDRLTPDCVQGTIEEMMVIRRAELPVEKRKLFDQIMAKKQKK
ncbi:TPA: peptide deformylase [Legionella pneumophila subsp. pneumophila]|nr:peptide deformylase [Legionella pneumophila subsp. pneumophila]HAT9530831.1 peptide deformylase [Legionella pneumophila subsp. pneumophila]HAU0765147.1 peptide deformylase [Legionella pneumophila]HAU0990587.1 peptide deformylase [Legionella pneumophila]